MKTSLSFLFLTSLIPSILSMGLAFIKYYQTKKDEFLHLGEFYASLISVVATSFFFGVYSVIPWVWTVRTSTLIMTDMTGINCFKKFHLVALGAGALISLGLGSLGFDLPVAISPFAVIVGFIGISFILEAFLRPERSNFKLLHYWTSLLILAYFLSRMTFPLCVSDTDERVFGVWVDGFLLLLFSVSLYPLYAEIVFEKQEKFLQEVLHIRNKQLFSHSIFSEYKILSAGVTHEINNALTIINAKIEQLLRRKHDDDSEKGLRVILNSTNRISRSIRGLREFIYPHDFNEVLSVSEVIDHVLMLYGQRLKNHNVNVTTNGLGGKLVKGHRIQLEQVFLTLINNSVESIDQLDEKWIDINCRSRGNSVEIVIRDSSTGEDEEMENMLSLPFLSTKENVDSGIRLVLAKDIVEKHGGTFNYIRDEENTAFKIRLPQVESDESMQNRIYQ